MIKSTIHLNVPSCLGGTAGTLTANTPRILSSSSLVVPIAGIATSISEYQFDSVLGKTVRITLNGNYKRVLCLAEVQVYGAVFEFDLPIGKLFNFPEMVINRFAFIQDRSENAVGNRDLEFESTIFANMVLSSDNSQSGAQSAVVSFDILRCLYIA